MRACSVSEQDSHIPLDRRTFLRWLSRRGAGGMSQGLRVLVLTGITALFLATGAAHAQTNGILTFACKGEWEQTITTENQSGPSEPTKESISLGIIVNFKTQTVEGFPITKPVKI